MSQRSERYTPGLSENATRFMAKRTLQSHGQFFIDHLREGLDVLDLGCGPGTISLGIADLVYPANVAGVDASEEQIREAVHNASAAGCDNAGFVFASSYALPFSNESFDRIFSHALIEHLARPAEALKEAYRVLKPGGVIGVCSPDVDGWLLAPNSSELQAAIDAYADLQQSNGGDLRIGKRLGTLLEETGFTEISMRARYECYSSLTLIGEYLALQLEREGMPEHAATLRSWSVNESGMFAQAWVSAEGVKEG